jgi:hypothetical protein
MGSSYKKVFIVFVNKELRKVFGCKRHKLELLHNGVQLWQPAPHVIRTQGKSVMFGRGKHAEALLSGLGRSARLP